MTSDRGARLSGMKKLKLAMYVSLDDVVEGPSWTGPFWNDPVLDHLHHGIFRRVMRICPVYFAASLVSSTARPLYSPHLGQARWGSFFSWQFGHSETPV